MKRKEKFIAFLPALLLASCFTVSCNKQNSGPAATEEQAANTNNAAIAESEANATFNAELENVIGFSSDIGAGSGAGIMYNGNERGDSASHCFTVSVTPLTPGVFPKTVVIDFGKGCTGRGGVTRSGKVTTVYSGHLAIAGSSAVTTFQDYYVDSTQVEGALTVTNKSTASGFAFNVQVKDGKLSRPSGNYIHWSSNRNWVQFAGQETPFKLNDDSYHITGDASGTVKKDTNLVDYSALITDALVRKASCRWITAGTLKFTIGATEGLLNFGDGECDNDAKLIVGGTTINISLR
ncbi:hypothetical protein [Foetidibacter luteolus]|uniref:hypothetical protein n=1 Tax=Foetidibacter luteolus TaxID=2608880 RepID=UPI00129B9B91|nr:hypothetical protein [Foetidibacter luteolus]